MAADFRRDGTTRFITRPKRIRSHRPRPIMAHPAGRAIKKSCQKGERDYI